MSAEETKLAHDLRKLQESFVNTSSSSSGSGASSSPKGVSSSLAHDEGKLGVEDRFLRATRSIKKPPGLSVVEKSIAEASGYRQFGIVHYDQDKVCRLIEIPGGKRVLFALWLAVDKGSGGFQMMPLFHCANTEHMAGLGAVPADHLHFHAGAPEAEILTNCDRTPILLRAGASKPTVYGQALRITKPISATSTSEYYAETALNEECQKMEELGDKGVEGEKHSKRFGTMVWCPRHSPIGMLPLPTRRDDVRRELERVSLSAGRGHPKYCLALSKAAPGRPEMTAAVPLFSCNDLTHIVDLGYNTSSCHSNLHTHVYSPEGRILFGFRDCKNEPPALVTIDEPTIRTPALK